MDQLDSWHMTKYSISVYVDDVSKHSDIIGFVFFLTNLRAIMYTTNTNFYFVFVADVVVFRVQQSPDSGLERSAFPHCIKPTELQDGGT